MLCIENLGLIKTFLENANLTKHSMIKLGAVMYEGAHKIINEVS